MQDHNLSNLSQKNIGNMLSDSDNIQLVILEQPADSFRFRYKSEMSGAHGSLYGRRSGKNNKTYPEVELRNFKGNGVIRCSLYQANDPSPHSHQLIVRDKDGDKCDPHDLHVSPESGYIARFQNMGIIQMDKKKNNSIYIEKKQKLLFELGPTTLIRSEEDEMKDEAKNEKRIDSNQVRLFFEAFEVIQKNVWRRIGQGVFSNVIKNSKNASTGNLKICHLSTAFTCATGGDKIILLVERLNSKNIEVRFFELDGDDLVWEAFGEFSDHHQYALVVQAPPYRDQDIDINVEVFIELVRNNGSDSERSPPVIFRYKPREKFEKINTNASSGDLKIIRLSTVFTCATGGDEIILLVEKLNSKNIQVRFFEKDGDDLVWEAFGAFSDHQQYAVVVRAPPYKDQDIDTNVEVFIELVRNNGSNTERSPPVDFRYQPREIVRSRMRRESLHRLPSKRVHVSSSTALASNNDPLWNYIDQGENFDEFMKKLEYVPENLDPIYLDPIEQMDTILGTQTDGGVVFADETSKGALANLMEKARRSLQRLFL